MTHHRSHGSRGSAGVAAAAATEDESAHLTRVVADATPRRSWLHRVALAVLALDRRLSAAVHAHSLFPFDILIAPFAMVCGIYSMPALIPLLGYFESPKLAALVLASTSDTTQTGVNKA